MTEYILPRMWLDIFESQCKFWHCELSHITNLLVCTVVLGESKIITFLQKYFSMILVTCFLFLYMLKVVGKPLLHFLYVNIIFRNFHKDKKGRLCFLLIKFQCMNSRNPCSQTILKDVGRYNSWPNFFSLASCNSCTSCFVLFLENHYSKIYNN